MPHSEPHSPRCGAYYSDTIHQESHYPSLEGELTVDVAIIGGGFTGINTALELAERGFSVAIVEANKIGWGATGRNGGQVTGSLSGDNAMRRQMRKTQGNDVDDFIWDLRWRGHEIIKNRIQKYGINCDLKFGHLHAAYKPRHMITLKASYREGIKRGMQDDLLLIQKNDIPDYLESTIYHGALYNKKNMHLHPLNLCLGEAAAARQLGVQIFEQSLVTRIEYGDTPKVFTDKGAVIANTVLLAGNAYHRLQRIKMSGKIFPAAGGIVATEPLGDDIANAINPKDLAVYDCRYFSLRPNKHFNSMLQPAANRQPGFRRVFPILSFRF